jgi:hypothetical protein
MSSAAGYLRKREYPNRKQYREHARNTTTTSTLDQDFHLIRADQDSITFTRHSAKHYTDRDLPHGTVHDDEHNESEWQATSAIKNSPDYVTEAK